MIHVLYLIEMTVLTFFVFGQEMEPLMLYFLMDNISGHLVESVLEVDGAYCVTGCSLPAAKMHDGLRTVLRQSPLNFPKDCRQPTNPFPIAQFPVECSPRFCQGLFQRDDESPAPPELRSPRSRRLLLQRGNPRISRSQAREVVSRVFRHGATNGQNGMTVRKPPFVSRTLNHNNGNARTLPRDKATEVARKLEVGLHRGGGEVLMENDVGSLHV